MTSNSSKSILVKIVVPILIVVVIAGIWQVKNQTTGSDPDYNEAKISEEAANTNPDFSLNITEEIDLEKLKSYGLPIIIDFGADYCNPCKEMAPVLQELNAELQGKAIVRYADVGKNQDLAKGYPLSVIPTQFFIDAGGKPYTPNNSEVLPLKIYTLQSTNEHVLTAHEGALTKEQLLAVLKEMGMK